MGTLGITIDWGPPEGPAKCDFSLKPDPARPAVDIAELLGEPVEAARFAKALGACLADITARPAPDADPALAMAVRSALQNVIGHLNSSDDIAVMTMGGVSSIGVLAPNGFDRHRIAALERLLALNAIPVVVIGREVAAVRQNRLFCDPKAVILFCRWGAQLEIASMRLGENGRWLAPLEERVRSVHGTARWVGQARAKLDGRAEAAVAAALAAYGDQAASDQAPAPAVRIVESGVRAGVAAIRSAVRVWRDRMAEPGRDAPVPVTVWATGPCAEALGVQYAIDTMLKTEDLPPPPGPIGDVLDCVEGLMEARRMLAYDIGLLVSVDEASPAAGRLLLVRPTPVGTTSHPERMQIPLQPGEALQVAAYLRRLDYETGRLTHEGLDSHPFVPHVADDGMAHLAMTAAVTENADGEVRITIRVGQEKGGEPLIFEDLKPEGRARDVRLLRDPAHFAHLRMAKAIRALVQNYSAHADSLDPRTWRILLDNQSSQKVSLGRYVEFVLKAAGGEYASPAAEALTKPFILESATPERIQAAARAAIFARLVAIGRSAASQHAVPLTQSWLEHAADEPTLSLGEAGMNAISQDLAAIGAADGAVEAFRGSYEMFKHACAMPEDLNIEWENGA